MGDQTLSVIYDGACGFCVRALTLFRRLDFQHRFELVANSPEDRVKARFPALAGADFQGAMFCVDPEGRVHRGYFAFRRMVFATPAAWFLLPLFVLPGSAFVGTRVYAWVARNRRNLGCESDVCERPPR